MSKRRKRKFQNDDFGFESASLEELLRLQEQASAASHSSPWPADALRALVIAIADRRVKGGAEPMALTLGGEKVVVHVKTGEQEGVKLGRT